MNRSTNTELTREAQIVQAFLELADTLVADFDIIDSLTVLARDVSRFSTPPPSAYIVDDIDLVAQAAAKGQFRYGVGRVRLRIRPRLRCQ